MAEVDIAVAAAAAEEAAVVAVVEDAGDKKEGIQRRELK